MGWMNFGKKVGNLPTPVTLGRIEKFFQQRSLNSFSDTELDTLLAGFGPVRMQFRPQVGSNLQIVATPAEADLSGISSTVLANWVNEYNASSLKVTAILNSEAGQNYVVFSYWALVYDGVTDDQLDCLLEAGMTEVQGGVLEFLAAFEIGE